MTRILKIDEYYNKWNRKVRWTKGDDGDVYEMSEPNHKYDCTYRGYKIENHDCTGGFQFRVEGRGEDMEDIIGINYLFDINGLKNRIDNLIDNGKLQDLTQDENGNNVVMYRWLDYFNNEWNETQCSVLSNNGKTAMIKLLEPGPRGKSAGSQMRVQLKSLVGFND